MKKSFFITAITLFLVPLAFYITHWQWHGPESLSHDFTVFLWIITETGSFPYAIGSSILLGTLLWQILGKERKIIILIILSLVLTQITMGSIKYFFASPRPFITVIHQHNKNAIKIFYQSDESQRIDVIQRYYQQQSSAPHFLQNHHIKSAQYSLYSFPSGHTIFVASWALLFAGLLRNRRGQVIILTVTSWAALVMASRVWLGMHYPIDLATSVFLATLINFSLLKVFYKKSILLS